MTDGSISTQQWNDESRQKSDIAGRAEFARAVGTRIELCTDGQGSTVFGLVGPWGSGKTTLLHEVVDLLDSWKVVWFTPWSVADVGSITAEFVAALAGAFPQKTSVTGKLATYARFGTPALKLIPVAGAALGDMADRALTDLVKRPSWHSEFGALSDAIADLHERVLIVVDDVDRLDGVELRALLRVVRLLGRFTNVHYLMAYDQATIDRALGLAGAGGASSEFMEKIVQYPFEVPPTPMVVRRAWSRTILDAVSLVDETMDAEYLEHRENLIKILASGLETPRAADRLREQILSFSELISNAEVDVLDFTALTWLRIAHHQVWDYIRLHPDDYLSWRESDSAPTREIRMQTIANLVRGGQTKAVQDAISFIFQPAGLTSFTVSRRWRMKLSRYFDRYFHVGLADDDVSEKSVEDALHELSTGVMAGEASTEIRRVIVGQNDEQSILALDAVSEFRRNAERTTPVLLEYVEGIRTQLELDPNIKVFRKSSADQWLAREVFLAFETKLLSADQLIERFGYRILTGSAYAAKRSLRREQKQIMELFVVVARRWADEVRAEPLVDALAREELLLMTSFCLWVRSVEDVGGFLAENIHSGESLAEVAMRFVFLEEWVGSGVHYDVAFREKEFLFAVGDAMTESVVAALPTLGEGLEYGVSDRSNSQLTDEERRDFAVRHVRAMDLT